MDKLIVKMYVKWMILKDRMADSVHDFLVDERGDVNIVSIVVLIGIAIVLAVIFRERIETLIGSLFDTIDQSASEVIE